MNKQISNNTSIAFHPTHNRIVEFMINMVEDKGSVLDAGFGEGAFLNILTTKSFSKIVGIEYSKEFFDKAIYLNAKLIHGDYLEYNPKDKFDLIIGNPPYMKYSSLNSEVQKGVEKLCKTKASDIYYAFIIKSIKLLKEDGILLFILPRSFFMNTYASYLRKFMLSNGYFEEIIDFGELNIFETANVETIIFKFRKSKKIHNSIKIYSTNSRIKVDKAFIDLEKTYLENKSNGSFNFSIIKHFSIKDKYWSIHDKQFNYKKVKLNSIVEIGVGFVSGCDEVFKISNSDLALFSSKEKDKFILKFLKANNIEKYVANKNLTNMLFFDSSIKSEEDINIFPNVLNYVQLHKEQLSNRYFANKKKPYFSWLAIRNKKTIELNKNNPIIIVPSLTRKKSQWFSISFEKNKYISSDIIYLIPNKNNDIYFILGILNSDFFASEYGLYGMKKGERFVFNQGFLGNFEIPYFSDKIKDEISNITKLITIEINRKKWSESKVLKNRKKIEKIIKENVVDINEKSVFGQLSFAF